MYKNLIILALSLALFTWVKGQSNFSNGFVSCSGHTGNVSHSFGEVFCQQKKNPIGSEVAEGTQQAQLLLETIELAFCQNDVKPTNGFNFHSVDASNDLLPAGLYDSSHYCSSFLNYDSLTVLTLTVWPVYEHYDTIRLSYEQMTALGFVPGRNDKTHGNENGCDSLLHYMVYVCGFPDVVDADDNNYSNIFIGNDCWLTENLRTTHYTAEASARQGTTIDAPNMIYFSAEFPDVERNLSVYGRLYTWYSCVGLPENSDDAPQYTTEGFVQGICPDGWHIPNDTDIHNLMEQGGVALSSDSLWIIPTGDNTSGFNALPAGFYNSVKGRFESLLGSAHYWSMVSVNKNYAQHYSIETGCDLLHEKQSIKNYGLSVRCLKDNLYSDTKWTASLRKMPAE